MSFRLRVGSEQEPFFFFSLEKSAEGILQRGLHV